MLCVKINKQCMYKAIQNQSNPFLSTGGLVENSMNILNYLLKFNDDLKCFIHLGKTGA